MTDEHQPAGTVVSFLRFWYRPQKCQTYLLTYLLTVKGSERTDEARRKRDVRRLQDSRQWLAGREWRASLM